MIRTVPIPRTTGRVGRLGTTLPCCPDGTDFLTAIFSDTCSYCSSSSAAAQQQLQQTQETTGVPCCDPSNGFVANLFDNSCNVCNPIGDAVGLSSVPAWAWILGAAAIGLVILDKLK